MAGQASFSTVGGALNITNTPGAIINWQGFSIGASETTRFIQQNAASSVLNRVIGYDPSIILGTLTSNGRVFLINPSGILFGQGSHIDVAGLVASTLGLSNQDFLAGRLNFTPNLLYGKVENLGSITTPSGGSVHLVGSNVTNSGIINSPHGDVTLAAGQSVMIYDTSTPGVRVEFTASDNSAVNLGEILAQSGQIGIYGAALRNNGIINADQVVRDGSGRITLRAKQDVTLEAGSRISANGERGGGITVQSETGTTLVSGAVEAKGTQGEGGTIKILGNQVGLIDNASVNASGQTGGGTVLVGGDFHGANSNVQNATATYVGPDATIKADAIQSGNGGNVAVWADDTTRYYGNISARGGANSGDGGFVEVSGKHYLDFLGVVNTLAPAGKAGTLLLDPSDITISDGIDAGMSGIASPFSGTTDTSTLNVTTLTNALGVGNVLVDASAGAAAGAGNITVSTAITWVAPTTLELRAKNDVIVGAAMTDNTAGAAIKLTAGHNVTVNGALSANGAPAAITLSAGHDVLVKAALSANGAGSVIELRADNLGTGTGKVTFSDAGSVSGPTPTTNIYYNPISYDNYAADRAIYLSFVPSGLNTYMLLFVDGLSADKTYNGNTTAVLTGIATIAPAVSDTVNLAGTGSVTNFSNKDVHTEVLTLSGYSINGLNASKYSLFQPASLSASITPLALAGSIATGSSVYGAALAPGAASFSNVVGSDDVTPAEVVVNTAGQLSSSSHLTAGSHSGIESVSATLGGTDAANYTFAGATGNYTVSQLALAVNATGVNKVYDGLTTATATLADNRVTGDLFATSYGTAAYLNKNVGNDKTVNVAGIILTGADAGNYTVNSTATTTANITPRGITGNITANNKVYDGTTAATIATRTLSGAIAGDTVSYSGGTALFSDKNAAGGKTVTGSGLLLSGADAGNYTVNGTATTTANITPAPLGITANSATRLYGDVNPAFSATYTGFQNGESAATLTGALAFTTPAIPASNVGNYTVIPSGQSSANYTVAYVNGKLNVTPAALFITADAQSKVYGTSDPALTYSVTGLVNNPALGITDTAAAVLSGVLTRAPGESALGGPYRINRGSIAANSNYTLGFTGNNLIITGAAAEPVLGFNSEQVVFAGVINNEFYYRPGNFWHISLNSNNADPGFDVMRGTNDLDSRLKRLNRCDSVFGGGMCETWSFPQQFENDKKKK